MTQLNTNFNAPFHVISKDANSEGVVASFNDRAEASAYAADRKKLHEALGNSTEFEVVAGQPALAQHVEERFGVPVAVQTDNSGAREAQQAEQLTASSDDSGDSKPAKSSSKK